MALVHDYLKEFGGAERVLMVLHEMFPQAPIYTAFVTPGSTAAREFSDARIIPSWANWLIRYKNLHSPLRFLIPTIWESFDFSGYDLAILSSSGYLTKPVRIPRHVRVICYCHTPSRFLYGYETSVEWKRYPIVNIYGSIVAHFFRLYDFLGAKRVDQFVANSKNVAGRIKKFYRKDAMVVYPPVALQGDPLRGKGSPYKKGDFFLVVSRIVGEKGIPMAMEAANKLGIKLKIVGEFAGLRWEENKINKQKSENIEFLGRVSDEELAKLYAGAKVFLCLEQDVDFGMTPVEAMAAGTPVVAYASGGYLESVVEGKTGTFFHKYDVESLMEAMKRVQEIKFKKEDLRKQAEKFSKEKFIEKFNKLLR